MGHWTLGILGNGHLDTWTLGRLYTWTLGHLDNVHLDTLDPWTLLELDTWAPGHLVTWTLALLIDQECKCTSVQVSMCPSVHFPKIRRVQESNVVRKSKLQRGNAPRIQWQWPGCPMVLLSSGATEYVVTAVVVVVVLFIFLSSHSRRRAVTSKFHVVLTAQKKNS